MDAKLAELDREDTGAAPESADPFAANIARMLGMLGYQVSDAGKVLIASIRDWGKALGVELLAGFGPAGLLLMLARITSAPETLPGLQKQPAKPVKEKPATIEPKEETPPRPPSAPVIDADADAEIDGFVAGCLEFIQGEHIAATPLFNAWKEYCGERGLEPGSPKGFSNRIRRRVQHDPNSGRPRYVGIRFKGKGSPRLKVVSG